jgi:hypothetical protein
MNQGSIRRETELEGVLDVEDPVAVGDAELGLHIFFQDFGVGGGAARLQLAHGRVHPGDDAFAVGAEPRTADLEPPEGLLKGFPESAADGHDLAHGLHGGVERLVPFGELLEGETRHLGDHIVDDGLEASRRLLGDVVGDLIQGVAHGQERGHLGDGEARGFGRQGGRP